MVHRIGHSRLKFRPVMVHGMTRKMKNTLKQSIGQHRTFSRERLFPTRDNTCSIHVMQSFHQGVISLPATSRKLGCFSIFMPFLVKRIFQRFTSIAFFAVHPALHFLLVLSVIFSADE